MRRAIFLLVLLVTVGIGRVGAAMPQNGVPIGPGVPFPDASADPRSHRGDDLSDTEQRRQIEAKRAGAANADRQKLIELDAKLILQTAAEVQLRLAKDDGGSARQDAMRQLDMIAKLAHTVKDKMKYPR